MAEKIFRFRSVWRVPAPLEIIWNDVGQVTKYPTWWPGIKRVDLLSGQELPIMVGTKAAYEVRSPLYTLRYQTEVIEFETGKYILATAEGDLKGTGRWSFQEKSDQTEATFDWEVAVTPRFLHSISHIPGVAPIMRYFHNQLMDAGEKGLQDLISKSYIHSTEPIITADG